MISSNIHLNGNILCVIDVETTGLDPKKNDIWQVCILPLEATYKPTKEVLPFYMDMKAWRPENIQKGAIKLNRIEFAQKQQRALDPWTCADMFDEWFQKLNLPIYKKIIPLAQNWPFDREFLKEWLGQESFEQFFSPLYRDLMNSCIFLMDSYDFRGKKLEFTQYNLSYICNRLNVSNLKAHDALQDCLATAECYRKLLGWAVI